MAGLASRRRRAYLRSGQRRPRGYLSTTSTPRLAGLSADQRTCRSVLPTTETDPNRPTDRPPSPARSSISLSLALVSHCSAPPLRRPLFSRLSAASVLQSLGEPAAFSTPTEAGLLSVVVVVESPPPLLSSVGTDSPPSGPLSGASRTSGSFLLLCYVRPPTTLAATIVLYTLRLWPTCDFG